MTRDLARMERLRQGLQEASLDGLVCTLPHNVLLLSGYWPVVGLSVAVLTREGQVVVLAPEDEEELAKSGWADEVLTFAAASLGELRSAAQIVPEALSQAAEVSGLRGNHTLGYENGEASVPVPYAALHLFGALLPELIRAAFPHSTLRGASDWLERMRAVLTPGELERVRRACGIGQEGFLQGAQCVQAGLREPEVASAFRRPLTAYGKHTSGDLRADGWVWCMSGPNAAKAAAAYARTGDREIRSGDLVLIHSNSYADGFWTDITRTFCLGNPDRRKEALYRAVLEAFGAALTVVRPGARAAAVDQAARDVLQARGLGKEFKHGTGHGVGFAAISHNARPRLHPASHDVLETGMVFNVEPAVYINGYGGLRHCSMVTVTERGAELLTPFQSNLESLLIA